MTGRYNLKLSPRQKEVLQYLCDGKTVKEIAALMFINVTSVRFHLQEMRNKAGLDSCKEITSHYCTMAIKEEYL